MEDHTVSSVAASGEKRKSPESEDQEERRSKLRRFDVKIHPTQRISSDKDSKSKTASPNMALTVSHLLDAEIMSIQSRSSSGAAGKKSIEKAPLKSCLKNSSKHAPGSQNSVNNNINSEQSCPAKMSQSNIVDELFKDYIATKMKEVGEQETMSNGAVQVNKAAPSNNRDSIEEINRLLDAEITSIQSRSVVSTLYDDDSEEDDDDDGNNTDKAENADDDSKVDESCQETETEKLEKNSSLSNAQNVMSVSQSSISESASSSTNITPSTNTQTPQSRSATTAVSAVSDDGDVKAAGSGVSTEKPSSAAGKKLPAKKLGLAIGQESLARILGMAAKDKQLEDGEVASSSDSELEKKNKNDGVENADDSADSEDAVSETGSLSDTEDEKAEGKDSKPKKKKKHKHKHKKKKKHKSQAKEKEKEDKDRHSTDKKSKDKDKKLEEDGKKSKDKKKHNKHRSRSKSPSRRKSGSASRSESHGRKDRRSRSSDTKNRSKSPNRERKQHSREPFDPWDARNYRTHNTDSERKRSHSPHRSGSPHRSRSPNRSHRRSKDRDRSKERSRSRERTRGRSRERSHERHRGRSRERHDEDDSVNDLRLRIDKNKLRKIAIANALAKMEAGQGPAVNLTAVKSGGKSVAELTEFCKRISEKEKEHLLDSSDSSSEEEGNKSDGEDMLIHHPFKIRDPSTLPNIIMNIRNAKQLPVLTPQEKQMQAATLRSQFPVSSGAQHRIKESEWVPVVPTSTNTATTTTTTNSKASTPAATTTTATVPAVAPPQIAAASTPEVAAPVTTPASQDSVFPQAAQSIDIGSIISERLQAVRRLQHNPYDFQALTSMHKAQEQAKQWAQSKQLPGQFTGSTDVQCLTPEELAGPDKRNQAWAKKDQFRKAQPIQGGIGKFLLQKMGWREGEGLGKNCEGSKEPLMLDVKMDRKGLTTTQELKPPVLPVTVVPRAKDLSGKHPVSALTELCTKRRWGMPNFELVSESGPDHKKTFLFKVTVNGVEYCPSVPCGNKKFAKAQAASICLQEMGLIPRDTVIKAV